MEMIDFQHLHFCLFNIGPKVLSEVDKKLLKKFGVDIDKVKLPLYSPSKKAFLFGRLAASLKDQTKKIDYIDFQKYLLRGQYIPLNKAEENILDLLENKLADSVFRESTRVKTDIQNLFDDRNLKWDIDKEFKELVHEEVKTSVIENRSKQEMVLEIGHKTGKWEKDLGRIAETELQDIYQYGKLAAFAEKSKDGEDLYVFKNVFAGACKYCIGLYLTAGIGSPPILFKISELIKNGTNIGRKQVDWRPVVGTTHPFCRCELDEYREGDEWDSEKQVFTIPDNVVERSRELKGEITITVGDKIIKV